MPYRPEARLAAMARCGLMSAPASRYSTRTDFGDGPTTARSAVVRLSTPHVAFVGAQTPGTSRLYELMVGQASAVSSGISFSCPAMKCFIVADILSALAGSRNRFFVRSLSHRLSCKWPLHPGRFAFHLAM